MKTKEVDNACNCFERDILVIGFQFHKNGSTEQTFCNLRHLVILFSIGLLCLRAVKENSLRQTLKARVGAAVRRDIT